MSVERLEPGDAITLVRSVAPDCSTEVASRLAEALDGNPLALVETPSLLEARARTGAVPLPVPLPVGDSVIQRWAQAVVDLPPATRLVLAVLAADAVQAAGTAESAWDRLGLTSADTLPAEEANLVHLRSNGWEFRHPLARSAVFTALSAGERRTAHDALARALETTDHEADLARHLAASVASPDAATSARLVELSTSLARAGAAVPAAQAAADAARLTPAGTQRASRLLAAARLALQAVDERMAAMLAQQGLDERPDPLTAARLRQVLGVAVGLQEDTRRGAALLRQAADVLPGPERLRALVDRLSLVKMWNDAAAGLAVVAEMGDLTRLEPWMCLEVGIALATAGRWDDAGPLLDRGLTAVDPLAPRHPGGGVRRLVRCGRGSRPRARSAAATRT